jgi:hypothetical protein
MIGRLALRSLTAHPIRSAVLAAGFGVGVAVMAILLGVAEIVLRQAQSPALVGGGDVLIRLSPQVPARLVLSGTLQSDALRDRVRVASPFATSDMYLIGPGGATRVAARAGIPSLERAIGDRETGGISTWRDSASDEAWTLETPERTLRQIDRFHPIPDAPEWSDSWAEWLYFNGRAEDTRFYLTFLAGPRTGEGGRASGVRFQFERDGRMETFSTTATLTDEEVARAPDLTIGANTVRLEGLEYRIHLDLTNGAGRRLRGDLALQASPGSLVPPLEIAGSRGWITGYVVPVMSGRLRGTLDIDGTTVSLQGGTGYHDHNWGFWEGVSWQWGQVQHEELSVLYGRVFPPPDAADPERLPGFVGVLGPDGPLAYATDVRISETNDAAGRPERIDIRARGSALDVTLRFDVASAVTTRMAQGPLANEVDFLQLRGEYTVSGRAGARSFSFTSPGAAETFRGR